jgi:hypothetical protein
VRLLCYLLYGFKRSIFRNRKTPYHHSFISAFRVRFFSSFTRADHVLLPPLLSLHCPRDVRRRKLSHISVAAFEAPGDFPLDFSAGFRDSRRFIRLVAVIHDQGKVESVGPGNHLTPELSKGRIRRKTYEISSSDSRSPRLAGFGGRLSGHDRERTRGVKTLFGFGPKIEGSVADRPDGLLLHENIFYSLFPLHFGMRQYWRDFESLERFTRAEPHREWWKQFLRDTGPMVEDSRCWPASSN